MKYKQQQVMRYCLTVFILLCLSFNAQAVHQTIVVKANQNIRDIAKKYLGDAELWQTVLDVNQLPSAASIREGMKLLVPDEVVIDTIKKIKQLNRLIKQANKLQARVFASSEISKAVLYQKQALLLKKTNQWQDASKLLNKAIVSAKQAIQICKDKQNEKAEAVLNDAKGTVDRKNLKTRNWFGAELFSTFTEGDRVRTLGESFAEILFKDESKLRLNSNSQIVIQSARSNLLKKTERTTVSVIKGGVFALLNKNTRNKFDVKVPGMKIKTDSKSFFINRDDKGKTKIANYGGKKIKITHKRKSVELAKDQGLFISKKGISKPKKLLPAPKMLAPSDALIIYKNQATFKWQKVKGAVLYWLEIANDAGFSKSMINANRLTTNSYTFKNIKQGTYFWRISSLDKDGFPSQRSRAQSFQYIKDDFPPYLAVNYPDNKAIVSSETSLFKGDVETGVKLLANNKPVKISKNGQFSVRVKLQKGINKVRFKATDKAGNSTEVIHIVDYRPIQKLFVQFDPALYVDNDQQLLTIDSQFTLRGTTLAKSRLSLWANQQVLGKTISNKKGVFKLSFALLKPTTQYTLKVTNKQQHIEKSFSVKLDNIAPIVKLASYPKLTRKNQLFIHATINGAKTLTLDENNVEIVDGKALITVNLKEGKNSFLLSATDEAGNITDKVISIVQDRTPPTLKSWNIERQNLANKKAVLLTVQVIEKNGLVNYVPYEVSSGKFLYSGYLNKSNHNQFSGLIYLPNKNNVIKLISLTLQDTAANKRQININKNVFIGR